MSILLFWSIILIIAPSLLIIHTWLQHRRVIRLRQIHMHQVNARLKHLKAKHAQTQPTTPAESRIR